MNTMKLAPNKKFLLYLGIVVIAAVTILPSMYFYFEAQKAKKESLNASFNSDAELKKVIDQVGKLTILPGDETPTLATVTDKSSLPKQPFYAQAENGDKILIYAQARKAYLYRPTLNKIIEIAPITVDPKEATKTSKPK